MNLAQLQDMFKKAGKMIYISNWADPRVLELKKAHMGLVDQTATGAAAEFDTNQDVVVPLGGNVKSLADTIAKVPAQVKSNFQTYLTRYVAVDLGLAANSSVAAVGTELISQMVAAGAHVLNAGLFYTYFNSNFAIVLPTNASPSVPDSWVDDDVIA